MSSVYFHEDDYCQIELLPIENLGFCLKQTGLINEFANAHKEGNSYTDIYMREDNPISMHDKKVLITLLENSLDGVLPKFDEVCTGYSSYREKSKHTNAFGQDENVVMFYDSKDNFINHIWFTLDISKENDIMVARDMFHALSKLGEFIIVDWGWDFVEKINNLEKIESYLQKRLHLPYSRWNGIW